MYDWLQFILALLMPPGISVLIGILSLYYCIRAAWFKSIFGFFISISLLYVSSIPLVADKLMFDLENKYQAFKGEDLSKYLNMNGIVAVFSDSYLSSDFSIVQSTLQLSKDTKLPIAIINLNNNRLYGLNANPINSCIVSMLKTLGDPSINIIASISLLDNTLPSESQTKAIQEMLEKNKIQKIFLISDGWNVDQAQEIIKKYGIEIIIVPIKSNVRLPINNKLTSFMPNGTSLLRSELCVKIYLNNFINKNISSIKKLLKKA